MAGTEPTIRCTRSTHFISDHIATMVTAARCPTCQQRLEISSTGKTLFYFSVACHDHFVAVQVEICPDPQHHGCSIFVRDVPCHATIQTDQINDLIRQVCNSIVLVQWDLRSDYSVMLSLCRQSYPPRSAEAVSSCSQRTQLAFGWLADGCTVDIQESTMMSSQGSPNRDVTVASSRILPRHRKEIWSENGSRLDNESNVEYESNTEGSRESKKRKRIKQDYWSNERIANSLISTIIKGQKKRLKDSTPPLTDRSDVQAMIWQHSQQTGEKDIVSSISQFEAGFSNRHKVARDEHQTNDWSDWYFAGCFSLINSQIRACLRNRAASAVYMINSITNLLFATDGKVAASIFQCLAGKYRDLRILAGADEL